MASRMKISKDLSITFSVILIVLLVGACGPILPGQGRNETATSAPIFTPVPPTTTQTSTPSVIAVTVTPSPLPTLPIIPVITPDPIQVDRWKEYQDALAMALFPPNINPDSPDKFLCEWEILGQSDAELYIWAVCMSITPFGTTAEGKEIFSSSSTPVVIHLGTNGFIQEVKVPGPGTNDHDKMFPISIQERFGYFRLGRAGEMSEHLDWRRDHPDEPPLIVLNAAIAP